MNPADPADAPENDEEDWEFTEEVRIEGDEDLGIDRDFGEQTDFTETYDDSVASSQSVAEDAQTPVGGVTDTTVGLDLESDAAAAGSVDAGIDLGVDHDASGLEIGGNLPPAAQGDESVGIEAGHDDSSFGAVDDFSSLAEEVDISGVDNEPKLNADLSDDSDAGIYRGSGSTDDLGDPESWDLAAGADFDSQVVSVAGLVDSFSSSGSPVAGRSDGAGQGSSLDPSRFDTEASSGSKLATLLVSFGSIVGWFATFAFVATVGYLSVAPEWTRWEAGTQTITEGSFSAKTTTTRWVDTLRAGPLLVIDGVAHNTGSQRLQPPSFQVVLLDAQGEPIPETTARAGAPMTERILRESTSSQLAESMRVAPQLFRAPPLSPGGSRAFQVVIGDVPDSARRLLLERADDSRAQPMRPIAAAPVAHESEVARTPGADAVLDGDPAAEAAPAEIESNERPSAMIDAEPS